MTSPRRTRKGSLQTDQVSELKLLIKESRDEIINVLKEDMNCLKQQIESLTSRITDMETAVHLIQRDHDKLKSEVSAVKTETLSALEASSRLAFTEIDNRVMRTSNIIIRGLPEETGSVGERLRSDKDSVRNVLEAVEANSADVTEIRRLGKLDKDRSRLLRVTLRSPTIKQQVLRKAKLLRNSPFFKDVFLQPDLTPMQQELERKLRKEVDDRRKQGEDVVIYAGEVRLRADLNKNFRL